jgi:hypothetical protein
MTLSKCNLLIGGGVNGSLSNGHYGPGDRKSRKEIMEEIIAKSKVNNFIQILHYIVAISLCSV